ncbi:MAG: hypothetical protein WAK07_14920 [Rhodomicrobium sp.]
MRPPTWRVLPRSGRKATPGDRHLLQAWNKELNAHQLPAFVKQRAARAANGHYCVDQANIIDIRTEVPDSGFELVAARSDVYYQLSRTAAHVRGQPILNRNRMNDAFDLDPLTIFLACHEVLDALRGRRGQACMSNHLDSRVLDRGCKLTRRGVAVHLDEVTNRDPRIVALKEENSSRLIPGRTLNSAIRVGRGEKVYHSGPRVSALPDC